jgi:hypothetical protein
MVFNRREGGNQELRKEMHAKPLFRICREANNPANSASAAGWNMAGLVFLRVMAAIG